MDCAISIPSRWSCVFPGSSVTTHARSVHTILLQESHSHTSDPCLVLLHKSPNKLPANSQSRMSNDMAPSLKYTNISSVRISCTCAWSDSTNRQRSLGITSRLPTATMSLSSVSTATCMTHWIHRYDHACLTSQSHKWLSSQHNLRQHSHGQVVRCRSGINSNPANMHANDTEVRPGSTAHLMLPCVCHCVPLAVHSINVLVHCCNNTAKCLDCECLLAQPAQSTAHSITPHSILPEQPYVR